MKNRSIFSMLFPLSLFLLLFLTTAGIGASEGDEKLVITFAVKDFQTWPQDADGYYGKDVAAVINTALQKNPEVKIFDRNANWTFMQELQLSMQGLTEEDRGAEKGKLISPDYFIEGEVVLSGENMVIRSRVYETQSRFVVASEQVQGKTDDFFNLEENLASKLSLLFQSMDFKTKQVKTEGMDRTEYDFYNQSLKTKSVQDKIALLEESLKKNPQFIQALHLLASAYEESKNLEDCISANETILGLDPTDYTACWNLGVHYFTLGDVSQAKEHFRFCIELKPEDSDAWYNLGVVSEFNDQKQRFGPGVILEESLSFYKKAVEINFTHEDALYAAGLLSGQLASQSEDLMIQMELIKEAITYLEGYVDHANSELKKRDVKKQLELFKEYLNSFEG